MSVFKSIQNLLEFLKNQNFYYALSVGNFKTSRGAFVGGSWGYLPTLQPYETFVNVSSALEATQNVNNCSVLIINGPQSNCMAIDIDLDHNAEALNELNAKLGYDVLDKSNLIVKTPSGGYHVYFEYDESKLELLKSFNIAHIDLQGDKKLTCIYNPEHPYTIIKGDLASKIELSKLPEIAKKTRAKSNASSSKDTYKMPQELKKLFKEENITTRVSNPLNPVISKLIETRNFDDIEYILSKLKLLQRFEASEHISEGFRNNFFASLLARLKLEPSITKELAYDFVSLFNEHYNCLDDKELKILLDWWVNKSETLHKWIYVEGWETKSLYLNTKDAELDSQALAGAIVNEGYRLESFVFLHPGEAFDSRRLLSRQGFKTAAKVFMRDDKFVISEADLHLFALVHEPSRLERSWKLNEEDKAVYGAVATTALNTFKATEPHKHFLLAKKRIKETGEVKVTECPKYFRALLNNLHDNLEGENQRGFDLFCTLLAAHLTEPFFSGKVLCYRDEGKTGKDLMFNKVLADWVFGFNYSSIDSIDSLTDRFNASQVKNIGYAYYSEIDESLTQKQIANLVKSLKLATGSSVITAEAKNKHKEQVRNARMMVMAMNNFNISLAGLDESGEFNRRVCEIVTSNTKLEYVKEFNELIKANPGIERTELLETTLKAELLDFMEYLASINLNDSYRVDLLNKPYQSSRAKSLISATGLKSERDIAVMLVKDENIDLEALEDTIAEAYDLVDEPDKLRILSDNITKFRNTLTYYTKGVKVVYQDLQLLLKDVVSVRELKALRKVLKSLALKQHKQVREVIALPSSYKGSIKYRAREYGLHLAYKTLEGFNNIGESIFKEDDDVY